MFFCCVEWVAGCSWKGIVRDVLRSVMSVCAMCVVWMGLSMIRLYILDRQHSFEATE